MFIQVRLLGGFSQLLWYCVPPEDIHGCVPGAYVRVPLRQRTVSAIIERVMTDHPGCSYRLRSMLGYEQMPSDFEYIPFIKELAAYYQVDYISLLKRLRVFLRQSEKNKRLLCQDTQEQPSNKHDVQLTSEQQAVVDMAIPALGESVYMPLLLHGVTGSGKTEVYKRIIVEAISKGRSVVLLLPEVTLAIQFQALLRDQLPESISIYSFHSATSAQQKRQLWKALCNGDSVLILGVHLPILLPIPRLGCIIVDEEHENGYQEKKHPRINTKEAAILRAYRAKIPIILGSGTPSITSLYNVTDKGWKYAQLTQRFSGAFPRIEVVSLKDKKLRRNFWISTTLEQEIKRRLALKEQTIIFLNRRGYSFFVQCKQCANVIMCVHCSVSLTLHENNQLTCHYCGISRNLPQQCDSCNNTDDPFLKKGIGTQQVVMILQKLFPAARIARADLDTTVNRKKWQQILDDMQCGAIDILVGTQTVTKGYHFPKVTLVGVLWADLNLHFPFYNAAEMTLQQLIQVAGRAGRATKESLVVIQTMIDHPIYAYLEEQKYQNFCVYELEKRKSLQYPPFKRFAELELRDAHEKKLEEEADRLVMILQERARLFGVVVLGPAKPPVAKVKNIHTRKIYFKAASIKDIAELVRCARESSVQVELFFTPNPLS